MPENGIGAQKRKNEAQKSGSGFGPVLPLFISYGPGLSTAAAALGVAFLGMAPAAALGLMRMAMTAAAAAAFSGSRRRRGERTLDQSLNRLIGRARDAGKKTTARLRERRHGAAADAAADQRLDPVLHQKTS